MIRLDKLDLDDIVNKTEDFFNTGKDLYEDTTGILKDAGIIKQKDIDSINKTLDGTKNNIKNSFFKFGQEAMIDKFRPYFPYIGGGFVLIIGIIFYNRSKNKWLEKIIKMFFL